ncbi:uncharacterized protein LOC115066052 [Bactrocera dorsalis]|uniref:Uncharacterized protein LOC115066052 n=1 Tax=Bactrocera dorsalis TaxID=27457 RepID=A0A8N4KYV6_BACDO|nr:uncharacterized protein LOC115066052 [Bactrocera dorsalis]
MNSTERYILICTLLFLIALARGVPVGISPYDSNSENNADFCTEKAANGFFADPSDTDCTSYINCYNVNGEWKTKLLKCPQGQYFDPALSFCSSLYNCSL